MLILVLDHVVSILGVKLSTTVRYVPAIKVSLEIPSRDVMLYHVSIILFILFLPNIQWSLYHSSAFDLIHVSYTVLLKCRAINFLQTCAFKECAFFFQFLFLFLLSLISIRSINSIIWGQCDTSQLSNCYYIHNW